MTRSQLRDEVQRAYAVDLPTWQREILAPRLQDVPAAAARRASRLQAACPRLTVRVIVSTTEGASREVLAARPSGADFSLIALKESIDPTAESGGVLPPISRGDLALPAVEARLFQAAAGELVGPLPVRLDGEQTWHLYRVSRGTEPWAGSRAEICDQRLEEDLTEEPVGTPEFARWRARTRRDFDVRVYAPDGGIVTRQD